MDSPRETMAEGSATNPARGAGKLLGLEGLRGVMALIIALAHFDARLMPNISLFSRPALAVETFFVLSGFVIHYRYANDIISGKLRYVSYVKKRFARLAPLHLFCLSLLLLVYAVGTLSVNFMEQSTFSLAGYPALNDGRNYGDGRLYSLLTDALLLNGIGFHQFDATWNYPSWSVSSELFVSIALAALFLRPRLLVPLCIVFAVSLYALLYVDQGSLSTHSRPTHIYIDVGLARATAGFCLGVLISAFHKRYSVQRYEFCIRALEIPAFAILFCVIFFGKTGKSDFLALAPIAVLVLSASIERSLVKKVLSLKFLSNAGAYSYSLYLLHVTIIAIFSYVLTFSGAGISVSKWLEAVALILLYSAILVFASKLLNAHFEAPMRRYLYARIRD
ncbi:hypothetical protein ASE36_03430 [Rhizobium sp. Root274]|uniref:acyltransferase family protein n=1 Tax=unclassified Rhizobium TaxID=2613769 RepID=UPI000713A45C|nr:MULTISPECIES: acyltransferase [unclassified Rhizobium]KQW31327.1 hypothetical protein ASC71_03430 [Rhizobium sp. Root1240]KRD32871.1 hypothetical protein ASE36_03430 [Rhizobium sp. Root274]